MISRVYRFCFGIGEGKTELDAFDAALLDAGIGNYNLVRVSSILPPGCRYEPEPNLHSGQILYSAYVREFCKSHQEGRVMSTAIAIAFPKDKMLPAVIMEYSGKCSCIYSQDTVTQMCHAAMVRRGIEYYEIKVQSNECIAGSSHTCIFGGVIFNDS